MDPHALFADYSSECRKALEKTGGLYAPKHTPTFVKNYDVLASYVASHGNRFSETQKAHLENIVARHEFAVMSGTADEAAFIAMLCNLSGFKKIIEIGTFLGYT